MNDILKQRLVGALILLALAVVFWPIIFVGPDENKMVGQQSIPPPPEVSTTLLDAPGQAGLRGSPELAQDGDGPFVDEPQTSGQSAGAVSAEGEATALPAAPVATGEGKASSLANSGDSEVRSVAPQPLAMDASGVPVAWSLQVATVSSADKAEVLRKRLLELNYKAFTTRVSSGGKSLYRISIGPKFERLELEKLQARINAEFGVTTMVVRYTP